MTNPINNYQHQSIPGYSGITINITNPTMHAGGASNCQTCNSQPAGTVTTTSSPVQEIPSTNMTQTGMTTPIQQSETPAEIEAIKTKQSELQNSEVNPQNTTDSKENIPQAYPPQYYLNNYNYIQNGEKGNAKNAGVKNPTTNNSAETIPNSNLNEEEDLTASQDIISELDNRVAEQKDLEKNGKQTKVIALTNEYIMSLENYLNNPNTEIRLMAAKEVLTRLDEDKERFDDAALNALLNKMLQDPEKLVRIAALSAFSSQLASGNDYTVQLLTEIQNNPNADKEDVLQAADSLLKMSSRQEVKYAPQNNNNIPEQQVEQQ